MNKINFIFAGLFIIVLAVVIHPKQAKASDVTQEWGPYECVATEGLFTRTSKSCPQVTYPAGADYIVRAHLYVQYTGTNDDSEYQVIACLGPAIRCTIQTQKLNTNDIPKVVMNFDMSMVAGETYTYVQFQQSVTNGVLRSWVTIDSDYDVEPPPAPLPPGKIACAPEWQTVDVGQSASFSVGSSGAQNVDEYEWKADDGSPSSKSGGLDFSTTYSAADYTGKTVYVTDSTGTAMCFVKIFESSGGGGSSSSGGTGTEYTPILVICPSSKTIEDAQSSGCPGDYFMSPGDTISLKAYYSPNGWCSTRDCLDAWRDVTSDSGTEWQVCNSNCDDWQNLGGGRFKSPDEPSDAPVNANYNDTGDQVGLHSGTAGGGGPDCGFGYGAGMCGYVYNDLNENGVKDPGEPGIAGVRVRTDPTYYETSWIGTSKCDMNADGSGAGVGISDSSGFWGSGRVMDYTPGENADDCTPEDYQWDHSYGIHLWSYSCSGNCTQVPDGYTNTTPSGLSGSVDKFTRYGRFDFGLTGSPTPTYPNAPTLDSAAPSGCNDIKLDWTDNTTDETGFRVLRAIVTDDKAGTFSVVKTLGPNITTYTDTGLTPFTQYAYIIQVYNDEGQANSNEMRVTPVDCAPNINNSQKIIYKVGNSLYTTGMTIKSGDVVTYRVIISNNGNKNANITSIDDVPSSGLVKPPSCIQAGASAAQYCLMVDKGSGLTSGSTITETSSPRNLKINVSGTLPPATNWIIQFEAQVSVVNPADTVLKNSATIHCNDGSGNTCDVTRGVTVLLQNTSGVPQFREVAP